MSIDVGATIAALDAWVSRAEAARDVIAREGAEDVVSVGRWTAPKLSGELASSITATRAGRGVYMVGPTVIYGRIRELGGRIPRFPMSHPYLKFEINGRVIYKRRVHQKGTHYMEKAVDIAKPRYWKIAYDRWAEIQPQGA